MKEPVITFSKWKIFCMTWFGYALGGVLYSVYFAIFEYKPSGYINFGPMGAFIFSIINNIIKGPFFLLLPMFISFSLNDEIRGTIQWMKRRTLILGASLCVLFNTWPDDSPDNHESHVMRFLIIALLAFSLPLFMLARRAETNMLYADRERDSAESENKQPVGSNHTDAES